MIHFAGFHLYKKRFFIRALLVVLVFNLIGQLFTVNKQEVHAAGFKPSNWTSSIYSDMDSISSNTYIFASIINLKNGSYLASGSCAKGTACLVVNSDKTKAYHMFGNSGFDSFNQSIQTSDGSIISVGVFQSSDEEYSTMSKGKEDAMIVKFTIDGANNLSKVWMSSFGGSSKDAFRSVAETNDGYVAVGYTESTNKDLDSLSKGAHDGLIVKFNKSGVVQWKRTFGGTNLDLFESVLVKSDGTIYVLGETQSSDKDMNGIPYRGGNSDAVIVKYDRDGNLIKLKSIGGSKYDFFKSIDVVNNSNNIVALGGTYSNDGDFVNLSKGSLDGFIVEYDSNLNEIWKKTIGGSGFDNFYSIHSVPEGGYIVSGSSASNGNGYVSGANNGFLDAILIRVDATGNYMWDKYFGGTQNDEFYDVVRIYPGQYRAVGYTNSSDNDLSGKNVQGTRALVNTITEIPTYPPTVTPGFNGNFIPLPSTTTNVRVTLNGAQREDLHTDKQNVDGIEASFNGALLLDAVNKVSAGQSIVLRAETIKVNEKLSVFIDAQTFQALQAKKVVIETSTQGAIYQIPTHRLNVEASRALFGLTVEAKDTLVQLVIQPSSSSVLSTWNSQVAQRGASTVLNPVSFSVIMNYKGQVVNLVETAPYAYISKWIPTTLTLAQYTTAMRIDNNGTLIHVPTKRITQNAKSYIVIQGLEASGDYGVVANSKSFTDISTHWAKSYILEGGARAIIEGVGYNRFEADRSVTRAEFAAMLIRGLGIRASGVSKTFTDVTSLDWFNPYVQTASAYNLVSGYEDGSFRPSRSITREEAMTMLSRAIRFINYSSQVSSNAGTIAGFKDRITVSSWAIEDVELNIKAKTIQGDENKNLRPKSPISRGETATVIIRLLNQASLIVFKL